jgi:hypothetical protein
MVKLPCMTGGQELNYHFSRLTNGAPHDVLAQLGKALLALDAQRRGENVDAPAALRSAWWATARWLIGETASGLNTEQQACLLSGALGDAVTIKNEQGERVTVSLLPADDYQALLADLDWKSQNYLHTPLKRMAALASEALAPLDLEKPGRYRGPDEAAARSADPRRLAESLRQQIKQLREEKDNMAAATRDFLGLVQADRLGPTLKPVQQLAELAEQLLDKQEDPAGIAKLSIPKENAGAAQKLRQDMDRALSGLVAAKARLLQAIKQVWSTSAVIQKAGAGSEEPLAPEETMVLTPQALKLIDKDYSAVNGMMVQAMTNSPQRTTWSPSRVLISENTEKFENPLESCYATAGNLSKSIAKIDALHTNCFPHDSEGVALLPPVVIEPGCGEVQWFDDRFILSFVCTEPARRGSKLSLSPVDLAVLRMFGQFLARGDIYDYRGDRITGNFAADYAGEVESKAKVKFTGAEKKMTIVSSSEIKDAAGRDEAVSDYMDFIYSVYNGMAIPKRITPRRIGVILKYCVIGSAEQTAILALRHVVSHDSKVVREILIGLAGKHKARVVQLINGAITADKQLGSRYRNDLEHALKEIMGLEFARDAARAGWTEQVPDELVEDSVAGGDEETAAHDYFDV